MDRIWYIDCGIVLLTGLAETASTNSSKPANARDEFIFATDLLAAQSLLPFILGRACTSLRQ